MGAVVILHQSFHVPDVSTAETMCCHYSAIRLNLLKTFESDKVQRLNKMNVRWYTEMDIFMYQNCWLWCPEIVSV